MGRLQRNATQVNHARLLPESGSPTAVNFNAIWYGNGQERSFVITPLAQFLLALNKLDIDKQAAYIGVRHSLD
jgi:hypothetical protein